jgi:hypothetical protein
MKTKKPATATTTPTPKESNRKNIITEVARNDKSHNLHIINLVARKKDLKKIYI